MELRQLKVGQVFELGGYEWLVLEHDIISESTLITTTECIRDMAFDTDNSNDFRNSTIRKYLNNEFLIELLDDEVDPNDILFTDFDLTKSNGNKDYGVCRDKIGLLTEEQYKKFEGLLTLNDWWWLLTPNAGNSRNVRYVLTDGSLSHHTAYNGYYGVRPALSLKASTEILADKPMELKEVINQLESLKTHCNDFADKEESESVWHLDILALDTAIKLLSSKEVE